MLIELNDQEANDLVQLLDVAVKGAGISTVPFVGMMLAKIQSAKQREEAGKPKPPRKRPSKKEPEE